MSTDNMSAQHTPGQEPDRTQRISVKPPIEGYRPWTDFEVTTISRANGIESRTMVRTTKDAEMFLDIDITMYTGMTGRARCCHVRLGPEAMGLIYEAISEKRSAEYWSTVRSDTKVTGSAG